MSFFGAAVCANAQLLNGNLDTAFYGSPLYVQTVNTGFGNSAGGGDATGSELDAVYVKVSGGNLYLFIAGCFQDNGNHLNVFIAGGGPGQNTLNVSPSTEANMNGSIFPVGFNATYMIDANDSSGTLYCDGFPLPNGSQATQAYLGPVPLTAGIGSATLGGITFALNNTLTSTMGGANTNLSGSNVGASVTNGLEIVIPTSAISYTGGSVNVLIDINGGGDGYLSNQFLPGLTPPPQSNLGSLTFNFGPAPTPTNYVTFQLDMSEQVSYGNFTNGFPGNSVAIGGSWNGFGTTDQLTNDPSLSGNLSNLYTGTFPIVAFLPDPIQCKFRVNNLDGGYEQPASTGGQNRMLTITNSNQVFPVITYDDLGLGDITLSNITVTFSLYMAPGTLDDAGYAFNPTGGDIPYISGAYWGWPTWGFDALPTSQQLVLSSTPNVYTNSFVLPRGTSIYMDYKYSINGLDDENNLNANANHNREIRSYGPTYAFPQDVWSWTLTNSGPTAMFQPGLPTSPTNIVEIDFGNLKIGAPASGSLPITWVGRPAVQLQSKSSLTSGTWNSYSGTDSAMSTNWPAGGSGQFFRLIKY